MLYDTHKQKRLLGKYAKLDSDEFSLSTYVGQLFLLNMTLGADEYRKLARILESVFGPVRSWYWAALPAQAVLMIPDYREPLNEFVRAIGMRND